MRTSSSAGQLEPTDSMVVDRDRSERLWNFCFYIVPSVMLPPLVGALIFSGLFNYPKGGFFVGLVGSTFLIANTIHRFLIQVASARGFVTLDQLRNKRSYVSYGPGLHLANPQERREARNNISLEEGSEDFEVLVRATNGFVTITGSLRMRPNIMRMVPFLTGAGSIATEVTTLARAFLADIVSQESIDSVTKGVARVNVSLEAKFAAGDLITEFEERFGVIVGDVTIHQIAPSADAQVTLAGLFEAEIIAQGTAILLGYPDLATAQAAGVVNTPEWNRRQDRFMATTKNLTMTLDANEYTIEIRGLDTLDPRTATAITEVATRVLPGATVVGGSTSHSAPTPPSATMPPRTEPDEPPLC